MALCPQFDSDLQVCDLDSVAVIEGALALPNRFRVYEGSARTPKIPNRQRRIVHDQFAVTAIHGALSTMSWQSGWRPITNQPGGISYFCPFKRPKNDNDTGFIGQLSHASSVFANALPYIQHGLGTLGGSGGLSQDDAMRQPGRHSHDGFETSEVLRLQCQ